MPIPPSFQAHDSETHRLIMEVGACWHVELGLDAHAVEHFLRANSGQLQDLRAVDGSSGQKIFLLRRDLGFLAAITGPELLIYVSRCQGMPQLSLTQTPVI